MSQNEAKVCTSCRIFKFDVQADKCMECLNKEWQIVKEIAREFEKNNEDYDPKLLADTATKRFRENGRNNVITVKQIQYYIEDGRLEKNAKIDDKEQKIETLRKMKASLEADRDKLKRVTSGGTRSGSGFHTGSWRGK